MQVFTTDYDNETTVKVMVYEGERYKSKENHLLGTFDLEGIAPAPRGIPQIEITYEVDANGILNCHGREKTSNVQNQITIANDKVRKK
jgi:molecular chaperone DnaK (HSP70)